MTGWDRRVRWASRRWWGAVTARYVAKCVRDQEADRVATLAGFRSTDPVDVWQHVTVDERRWYGWPCSYVAWVPIPGSSLIPVDCN